MYTKNRANRANSQCIIKAEEHEPESTRRIYPEVSFLLRLYRLKDTDEPLFSGGGDGEVGGGGFARRLS